MSSHMLGALPSLSTITGTFFGNGIAIRIHRGQNVNTRIVQQPTNVRVTRVTRHQVLNHVQQHFLSHRFVTMNVSDILNVWLANHMFVG